MTIPPQIIERMAQRIREVVADDWSGVPEPARECAVCYHAAREALSDVPGLTELIEAAMEHGPQIRIVKDPSGVAFHKALGDFLAAVRANGGGE